MLHDRGFTKKHRVFKTGIANSGAEKGRRCKTVSGSLQSGKLMKNPQDSAKLSSPVSGDHSSEKSIPGAGPSVQKSKRFV